MLKYYKMMAEYYLYWCRITDKVGCEDETIVNIVDAYSYNCKKVRKYLDLYKKELEKAKY